ncbi:MAG: hypothetical protein J6O90_04250 [Candidatus Methanomethylophilaceae archaeon]|nr:hypothetical protein [Candidatus Methanomethylophilaceae archaeon]
MEPNTVKKFGVWIIVLLFALYVAGYVLLMVLTDLPVSAIAAYGVIMFVILAVLAYEGWQRIKEIDGGLEDAVDNY